MTRVEDPPSNHKRKTRSFNNKANRDAPSTQEDKFMLPHNDLTPQTKSSKNGWIRYLRAKKGNTTS